MFIVTYRLYCHAYVQGSGNLIKIFNLNCHSLLPLSLELKNLILVFSFLSTLSLQKKKCIFTASDL